MNLVFATNNAHKLEEVRKILPSTFHILSLSELGCTDEIDETGTTLEANSLIKAQYVWDWLATRPSSCSIDGVFADDTGLEIDALNGAPGVYTARWAGDAHNAAANRQKALRELQGISNRSARFRTVVTLLRLGKNEQVEGIVCGSIATEEHGDGGFGYDSLFIPNGYDATFAELPANVKNTISHRARAMEKLKQLLG